MWGTVHSRKFRGNCVNCNDNAPTVTLPRQHSHGNSFNTNSFNGFNGTTSIEEVRYPARDEE